MNSGPPAADITPTSLSAARGGDSPDRISPRPVAVIDIGATSVRMAVAEISSSGDVRKLDTLVQPLDLGREAFATRRLSRKSIERAAEILRRYRRALREYGITSQQDVRVVATSAVREAINRLAFIDRVYIATGLEVEPLEEAEVNRITYMGIIPYLAACDDLRSGKSVVVEVGGGSTELLVVRGGNVLHSESYRLGSVRLLQTLDNARATMGRRRELLETHIRRTLNRMAEQVRADVPLHLVAIGGDIRFAARRLLESWDPTKLVRLETDRLARFTEEVLPLDEDAIVKRFGASFIEAETLGPALLTYTLLAQHFSLSHVHVGETNLRDGVLHDMSVGGRWTAEFRTQIIRSAISLGRKLDFDEAHARAVAELARQLFDELRDDHRLDSRYEVILFVAALLHEVGLFVNVRSNHKHALYLIRNSDLFGLSRHDKLLVGLVARYHRRAFPQPTHDVYRSLHRDDRVAVAKMAALLRLAIALDDTRSGRVREIRCNRERKRLVITVPGVKDVSLDQLAMRQNAGLFQEIYGVPVLLRGGG